MSPWVDSETGELFDGCPNCDEMQILVDRMEAERRADRIARTKAERMVETVARTKHEGAAWKRVLATWMAAFPDKHPTAKGVKSARATAFFLRIESGASVDDFEDAIRGAKEWPYMTFGKRTRTATKESSLAIDIQEIAHLKADHLFDFLRDAGKATRAPF